MTEIVCAVCDCPAASMPADGCLSLQCPNRPPAERSTWNYLMRYAKPRFEAQASKQATRTRLTLPWPPSVNHYWRFVPGKASPMISREGRAYRATVRRIVLEQGGERLHPGRHAVSVTAFPPDRRRRDLDNLLKALLDALAHAGVYADDESIDLLMVRRMYDANRRGEVDVLAKVIRA